MKYQLLTFLVSATVLGTASAHEDIKHEKNPAYVWDSYGNIVRDQFGGCVRTIEWKEDAEACGGEPKVKAKPVAVAAPAPKAEPKAEPKPEPKTESSSSDSSSGAGALAAGAAVAAGALSVEAAAKAGKPLGFSGLFENNGHDLTDEAKEKLDKYAAYMKDHPSKKLEVTGHTDSRGQAAYNQQLSQKRADKVKDYLVDDKGIESDRIKTFGKGESQPIADNATKAGRAENRRVEIEIVD